jgi:hypothetical protein
LCCAECKEAIEVIQRAIGDLDAAAISATVGLLEAPVGGPSNQQCKEELITLSRDLATATGKLVGSAKENPEVRPPFPNLISLSFFFSNNK